MFNVIPIRYESELTNGYYTRTSYCFVLCAVSLLCMAVVSFIIQPYPYDPIWIALSILCFAMSVLLQIQQMLNTLPSIHDDN